jgi:integrase
VIQSEQATSEKKNSKREFVRVAECLYKLKPYGKYYGQSRHHGKLFRESLKTSDRQLAEARLKGFLERVGKIKPGTGGITFEQALEIWRKNDFDPKDLKDGGRKYREDRIKGLKLSWPTLWSSPIRKLTETECKEWFTRRRKEVSAGCLNSELDQLRMVFKRAMKDGIISEDPTKEIERVKVVNKKPVIPSHLQFMKLITYLRGQLNDNAADFVESLAYSGMRCWENAEALLSDVDFIKGKFTVTAGEKGTKNSEVRTIPLFPALRTLWERIRDENELKPNDRLMFIRNCKDVLTRACVKLELPHFTHHHFRHFFVANAIELGVDFKTIASWLGHKDGGILVAKTYGHLREEHSERMAEKMTFSATSN